MIEVHHPLGETLELAEDGAGRVGHGVVRGVAAPHDAEQVGEARARVDAAHLAPEALVILDEQVGRVLGRLGRRRARAAESHQRAIALLVERGDGGCGAEIDPHRREALEGLEERPRIADADRERGEPGADRRVITEGHRVLHPEIEGDVLPFLGDGPEIRVRGVEQELGVGAPAARPPRRVF